MLKADTFVKMTRFVTLRRISGPRIPSAINPAARLIGASLRAVLGIQTAQIGPRELERVIRRASRFRGFAGAYVRAALMLRALRVADDKDRSDMLVDLRLAFA